MEEIKVNEIIALFNEGANDAACLIVLARDSGLQEAARANMLRIANTIDSARIAAAAAHHEQAANFLLGMQCAAQALAAELQLYLLLKQEEPEAAWDALIDAQDALQGALRCGPEFAHLEPNARRVRELEKWLFPPQMFLSPGMIVRKQICTICREDYSNCDHLVGMPYNGEFCSIQLAEIEANHVAIVDEPANRRCRITKFSVPGGTRNRMTWVISPDELNRPPEGTISGDVSVVEGILDTFRDGES